jgi:O-antigen/teichoic acid export membrane protein
LYFWRDISLFHPTLKRWRDMIAFGGYTGTNVILARFYETVPSLVLGQTAKNAVGFFDRSKTICDLPEKVFLSGFIAVSLPAFSAELRAKNGLKTPYLKALNYITVLLWPALVCVAILADPIVAILLGAQWGETVPIVRIVALAWLFTFSSGANFAVLTASGAIKAIFVRALITWPASAVILASCAYFGLKVMALGFFIVVPFQALVAIQAVRQQIPMSWGELVSTLKKSFWVTLFTASGPLAMVALIGFRFDFSILQGILAGLLAGVGWLAGLWMTGHPFLDEIFHVATALRRKPAFQKILGRWS